MKVEPLAGRALGRDAAAVLVDELLGDREPEAGAARVAGAGLVGAVEALEHVRRAASGGIPMPVSVTATTADAVAAGDVDLDLSARRRV